MGRIPDLPCDIEQVVELLGIEVIRDTGTQLHCRCPFCADRKAHMYFGVTAVVKVEESSTFTRSTVMSTSIRLTKNSVRFSGQMGANQYTNISGSLAP